MTERPLARRSPIEPSVIPLSAGSYFPETLGHLPTFDFEQWAKAGFPPIVEGREITDEDRQRTTQFFKTYLQGNWRGGEPMLRRYMNEENARLKWMLPDIYEAFLVQHDLHREIEVWRKDQEFWETVEPAEVIADWRAGKMFRNRFLDQRSGRG